MSLTTGLFTLLALLGFSAFFSISEISLAAARKFRLQMMADEGEASAPLVIALQEKPGDFFTVVQVGVNAVAILGGIVGDATFTPYLTSWFARLNVDAQLASTLSFLLSFLITTGLFIQFADLIPKRLGMLKPEQMAVRIVKPMMVCTTLLRPLVWLFDGVANLIFRIFKVPTQRVESITSDEIVALVDAGAEAGTLQRKEHLFIENMFELGERFVTSVMTAREQVIFFTDTDSNDVIRQKITDEPHAKFLLCKDGIDSVYAYVDAKDLLQHVLKSAPEALQAGLRQVAVKSVLLVPDTISLSEALDRFKETHEDFAVVINEYALVVGIFTLNDVIRHLIGSVTDLSQQDQIVRRDDSSWLVDGVTPITDLKAVLEIDDLPDEENYETVAGLLMYLLKKIPKKAEAIDCRGYRFEVVDIDHYRIDQVLVTRLPLGSATAAPNGDG
ncbi:hemolysin family protein [Jeongeupia naejangsanensis]|uniref:Polyamine export protein n=1 Tax=Jeongeupia naejangsanensis TaxID=613195 RepID=A0ABS2BPA6_9NEIS|nr:hemolysin family protein [Jeongeupia naejangsanensis]MBM3117462.1 HlyC/CorC family transporter [Jeongeupia naejangsanensis]